ncbi:unnamed protein product [Adineta steineri]|uniref:Uncharacterized protein n=1 Tax=Adineta steineri TaxID=433720 RepID=A0A814YY31_9BILA|nr:unnamed protein product [Adineta steineri]CAF3498580.1 unnamed protein product [Adineta steineri]
MPLQDVTNDPSMIGWLRQAGHSHLLNDQNQYANSSSSPSLPIIPAGRASVDPYHNSFNRSSSHSQVVNFNNLSNDQHPNSRQFVSSTPSLPIIRGGQTSVDSYNHSPSFTQAASYNHSYGGQPNYASTPTQFHAPYAHQYQTDADIEYMKRDPNTRIIQRPSHDDVVYRQRVFVKYLQPPTPPVAGAIIVREKQLPQPPPDPPLVIKRAPPPPPTPPPVVIRERPPQIPPPEGTTIINKIIPPPPKPPRQVIIEQFPQLPRKPQDVILEKWLPVPPRQRRIFYERLPAPIVHQPQGPIVIQHGQPRIHIQRQIVQAPGPQFPYQQVSSHTDLNQLISPLGVNQQIYSAAPPSSLISYSPYSGIDSSCGSIIGQQQQPRVITVQQGYPNLISAPSYGIPTSYACTSNPAIGLGTYGSGLSAIPSIGYTPGHSQVFTVPEHVPVDGILRQLGVDPYSMYHSPDSHSSVAHVWDAAARASSPHPPIDPHGAVSHVWNAASRASSPNSLDPRGAVSHVWNAAAHASSPHPPIDPHNALSHVWSAASRASSPYPLDPRGAVSHVWNAAAHASPSHPPTDPHNALSHVWSAASRASSPYPLDPRGAVSHVWNAASHAIEHNQLNSPASNYSWNNMQNYPYS